jgi:hypothetical protein
VIVLVTLMVGAAGCVVPTVRTPEAAKPAEPTSPPEPAATQAGAPTAEQPTAEAPTQEAQPVGKSSITIVIPEDPPSFNAIVGDTGYDALVMNLV